MSASKNEPKTPKVWEGFDDAIGLLVAFDLAPDVPGLELIEEGPEEGRPAVDEETGYFKAWRLPPGHGLGECQRDALAKLKQLTVFAFETIGTDVEVDYFPGSKDLLDELRRPNDPRRPPSWPDRYLRWKEVRLEVLKMALWQEVQPEAFREIKGTKVRPIDWLNTGPDLDDDPDTWYRARDRLRFAKWMESALLRHGRGILKDLADVPSAGDVSLDEPLKTDKGEVSWQKASDQSADHLVEEEASKAENRRMLEKEFEDLIEKELKASAPGEERRAKFRHLRTFRDYCLRKPGATAKLENEKTRKAMDRSFRRDLRSDEVRRKMLGDPDGEFAETEAGAWTMTRRRLQGNPMTSRRERQRERKRNRADR